MVNKASGNQFQVPSNLQSKIGADPVSRPEVQAEKPAQQTPVQDGQTTQSVRIGASAAPTAQQAAQNQGGLLQAQISGMRRQRSSGKRTSKLKLPEGAQLLRGMKNPEPLKALVAELQAPLSKALGSE